jgi:Tol biopolymer transport system component
MRSFFARVLLFVALLVLGGLPSPSAAQYFGQNKVQYEQFDFRTFQTDQFDIYFYPAEKQAVQDAARMAERWYDRHSRTFLREFQQRKPLIFYANSPDFQQTNAVRGRLGQGTGGVTESLKERVIMPLTGSYAETDHVLGHELVHSFQYDIALRKNNEGFSLRNMPLWFIEGMAEYLAVGRSDSHTAMWMRDAALRDDLPTIRQLTRDQQSFFPYRYGQAYMAYIGGKYGDAAVTDLYKMSGRVGVDSAFVYTLGITADSLSEEWKEATRERFLPGAQDRTPVDSVGTAVIGDPGGEYQLNISPSVSPDGRYVAFISRRNLFNTNLFVADAETGEIVQQLEGTRSNPHFDALRFINSAGSWSPDGRRFAFITFAEGRNEINTFNVQTGEIQTRTTVKEVGAIHNLAWGPEGRRIAFSGLQGGLSDLYIYNLETETARQLTNDRHSALQPTWAPDGEALAFTTDRGPGGTDFETLSYGEERIGLIEVSTGEVRTLRPFTAGMQHNPQFSPDGRSVYFIADPDGHKDVYRYDLDEEATYRVTEIQTGVSGITAQSPALSVARRSGRMMFSVFSHGGYSIMALPEGQTRGERVAPEGGMDTAAALPPVQSSEEPGLVGSYLEDPLTGLKDIASLDTSQASNRLYLDRIIPPSVGTSVGGVYGPQVTGGIGFSFSDILGHQNLSVFVQANGTIQDIGGGVFYSNRENRVDYGVGISHQPSAYGQVGVTSAGDLVQIVQRIFRTQVGAQASYPFSQTNRLEFGVGGTRYGFDVTARVFDQLGRSQEVGVGSGRDPLYFARASLAYVGDFSNFGLTSPLQGGRYRFQVTPQFGSRNFVTVLADYRRYLYREPVTFAIRGLHRGNYGAGEFQGELTDTFVRETLGDPYQSGFVRGYSFNSIFEEPKCQQQGICEVGRLYGTRMALGSAEVRVPLLGPEVLSLSTFQYLPTDLVLFADAGVAWTGEDLRELSFSSDTIADSGENVGGSVPGVSARVNVLGALIFEAFYARTFQRSKAWDFGVILRPGW